LTLTIVLAALLAGCGGGAGAPTAATETPIPTITEAQATSTTEARPTATTEAQATTPLPAGTVSFSGDGAFTSEPFSLPGPSSRYIVESTASRVGDSPCLMAVRIQKGGLAYWDDVFWWATYTYESGPSTETHTQELTDVSPSDQFRLVTEPDEVSDCIWTVTLRPD
jgi:hypothetical protein